MAPAAYYLYLGNKPHIRRIKKTKALGPLLMCALNFSSFSGFETEFYDLKTSGLTSNKLYRRSRSGHFSSVSKIFQISCIWHNSQWQLGHKTFILEMLLWDKYVSTIRYVLFSVRIMILFSIHNNVLLTASVFWLARPNAIGLQKSNFLI